MISRRRFIALSAAFSLSSTLPPARASSKPVQPVSRWRGTALGAEAEITLQGPATWTEPLLREAEKTLADVDALFSLFNANSSLARLNAAGKITEQDARFHRLLDLAHEVHRLTDGLFDPTVQPLWQALANGGDIKSAREAVGWHNVQRSGTRVQLAEGQAITLNGIAQGFATDLIAEAFQRAGARRTLINIGEFRAIGGPWHVGLSDPNHGLIGRRIVSNSAIATSSPGVLTFAGADTHILNPAAPSAPLWSTVSVEADSAALADGLSTALCHANTHFIRTALAANPHVQRITLIDSDGDLVTL
ncbi:MAG: FAD:protein FMN transferase [Stappiaceae bacterium]